MFYKIHFNRIADYLEKEPERKRLREEQQAKKKEKKVKYKDPKYQQRKCDDPEFLQLHEEIL